MIARSRAKWPVLFAAALLLLVPLGNVQAASAAPVEVTLTQPDGSSIEAVRWGDEFQNGYETLDGYTIVQDPASGAWVYLTPEQAGPFAAPAFAWPALAGRSTPAGLPKHLRPAVPASALAAPLGSRPARVAAPALAAKGVQPLLIILASATDQGPVGNDDATYWRDLAFGPNPSVTDYYWAASYGQLQLVPAQENDGTPNDGVVGWINAGRPHPRTGTSDLGLADPRNAAFAAAAMQAAAASGAVNFAAFDSNRDGTISPDELHVVIVVAGYEASFGDPPDPSVWAYSACLYPTLVLQGVQVLSCFNGPGYVVLGEWHAAQGYSRPATLGPLVHELGHTLGLPDLYDTTQQTSGVGNWSVMSGGNWNSLDDTPGDLPALPDAWSRAYLGWLAPQEVQTYVLGAGIPQAENDPVAFQLLPNPGGIDWRLHDHAGTGEYYLVENRQLSGYDAGLPGCGVLVWHIDESVSAENQDANSDPNRRLVDLLQADGLRQLNTDPQNNGDAGDPFPGASGRRAWGSGTDLPAFLDTGLPSPAGMANISDCAATMAADLYSVPITPPAQAGVFADLSPTDMAYPWAARMLSLGWTDGCATDPATGKPLYCPMRTVTRREMAKFLVSALGLPVPPGGIHAFADVAPDDWGYPWIQALYAAHLTDGCGRDPVSGALLYCPNAPVARAEMAKFLVSARGLPLQPSQNPAFSDVPLGDPFYPWVQTLFEVQLTEGCSFDAATGERRFCPSSPVLRWEMAKFLVSAFAPNPAG